MASRKLIQALGLVRSAKSAGLTSGVQDRGPRQEIVQKTLHDEHQTTPQQMMITNEQSIHEDLLSAEMNVSTTKIAKMQIP